VQEVAARIGMARVLIGVSGGIAAYKAVELVRLAGAAGHSARVIQTEASERFVGRSTFEGITGAPVLVSEWERDPARGAFPGEAAPDHAPISHLELVRRAEVYAITPASANTLAKLAAGLADNLLTSAALAAEAPLVVAPAMNDRMWEHPATRANVAALRDRGVRIVEPDTGALASRGEWGTGRLAEPSTIMAAIEESLAAGGASRPSAGSAPEESAEGPATPYAPRSLDGLRVLVTAGGTREPIDAVRYVGNRSSGRMGLALAEEAAHRGAEVVVVAANVAFPRLEGVRYVDVETAAGLAAATREEFERADVLLMAAAVADFRPAAEVAGKIERAGRERLDLELEPTEDVLAAVAATRLPDQTVVGFAAEHGSRAVARGREKLERKRLDVVVVNDVSEEGIGFESPDNAVRLVTVGDEREVSRTSKREVARAVLDLVEELRARGVGTAGPTAPTAESGEASQTPSTDAEQPPTARSR
jgi:phosphopantothenoylcysteine decarboxylase / phosphopantothenate---cysteine ligase